MMRVLIHTITAQRNSAQRANKMLVPFAPEYRKIPVEPGIRLAGRRAVNSRGGGG
jgi:hypothetical protein